MICLYFCFLKYKEVSHFSVISVFSWTDNGNVVFKFRTYKTVENAPWDYKCGNLFLYFKGQYI